MVRRHRGLRLNHVVVTTTTGEVWLTRAGVARFARTPDLDEELAIVQLYWRNWKQRHQCRR